MCEHVCAGTQHPGQRTFAVFLTPLRQGLSWSLELGEPSKFYNPPGAGPTWHHACFLNVSAGELNSGLCADTANAPRH